MVDTSWTVDDGVSTYTIDGVSISDGWPDFQVGEEMTLTFIFNGSNHLTRYKNFTKTFAQPHLDGLVVTGQDFNTVPYYSITQRDSDTSKSFLWELTPAKRIDGVESWWVVPTSIDDNSRMVGVHEEVPVTMFVIAPRSEGNRKYIEDRYEEEL